MRKADLVRELRRRDEFEKREHSLRRIAERDRDRLELGKQAALAVNAAKERFFAVLSHELRTPLTPILTLVTGLEHSEEVPAKLRNVFQRIRRNIEMEARLIDQLLYVTRIDSRNLELCLDVLDMNVLVRDVIDTHAKEIRDAGIDANIELTAKASRVKGDPVRLSQVVSNLLANAVKFTPAGGSFTVRTYNRSDRKIVTSVRDNGIGIDPARTETLFTPFEQAHYPGKRTGGLGLGLAICKSLVEAHRGSIWVQSTGIGHGAEFAFELPTTDEPLRQRSPVHAPRKRTVVPPTRLKILLVEDHTDSALTIAELLERQGHTTKIAPDMRTALELSKEGFDLVLSDIALPDGSGLELIQRLRQSKPVLGIALSGFGGEADVRNSLRAGFSEHLTKPVSFQHLLESIERVVAHGQTNAAS